MEPTATEVVTGDIDGDLGDPRGVPALQTRASRFRERWRDRHTQPGEGTSPGPAQAKRLIHATDPVK